MKTTYRLTQKRWEAIQNNTQFDGDFYGVTTTKIFVVLRALPCAQQEPRSDLQNGSGSFNTWFSSM